MPSGRGGGATVSATLTGVFLILAVAAAGSAVYAWHQLKTNEALLDRTLRRATDLVNTAVGQAEQYGVSRALTLKLLEQAEGLFDDVAELGRETPQLRYRKAWMLIEFARNYEILGDTNKQRVRAAEAHRLLALLVSEKPGDVTYQRDLSVAYNEVGRRLVAQGNLAEALTSFRNASPSSSGWSRPIPATPAGSAIFRCRYGKVGKLLAGSRQSRRGDYVLSWQHRHQRAAHQGVPQQSAIWHVPLGVLREYRRRAAHASQSRRGAVSSFAKARDIREWLAKAEPNNPRQQSQLSVSYEDIGDMLLAQGDIAEGLVFYRNSFATQRAAGQG